MIASSPCDRHSLSPDSRYVLKVMPEKMIDRLTEYLDGGTIRFGSHEVSLNFSTFEWEDTSKDRTWWWRVQQLPILELSSGLWSRADKSFIESIVQYNQKTIRNWRGKNYQYLGLDEKKRINSNLAWHDHTTALRMQNLFKWTQTLIANNVVCDEDIEFNLAVVLDHLDWLMEEKNYTRHTNHGYDQAFAMLEISTVWRDAIEEKYREISLRRIIDEVSFGFTFQGVHVENSPSYHFYMLQRLERLEKFLISYDIKDGVNIVNLKNRARDFLFTLLTPNKSLPLIGDTELSEKASLALINYADKYNNLLQEKRYGTFDYSDSGYIIYKSKEIYLVLKSCHDSDYHRHDDDLSLYLLINGEEVFIDSGRYTYNNNHPVRKYVRSLYAHTTTFLEGYDEVELYKRGSIRKKPQIQKIDDKTFEAVTFRFPDVEIYRRVTVFEEKRIIEIKDSIVRKDESDADINVLSNFILSENATVKVDGEFDKNYLINIGEKTFSIITNDEVDSCQKIKGLQNYSYNTAVISRIQNEYIENSRLCYRWSKKVNAMFFSLKF